MEEVRRQLLEKYNAFVEKFGAMSLNKNKKVILEDPEGFVICSSLEIKESHNVYRPADILYRSNKVHQEVYKTDDPVSGLLYVLSMTGKVDIPMISEIVDRDSEEIIRELGDNIYYNPISQEWEESSKFLSGNVYVKKVEIEKILEQLKQEYANNSN